jgi:hypothetical protein
MITIYIESDDGDNNLRNVDSSLVKTHEECLLLMHYAWLKSNVSSETYQFNVYSSLDDQNELLEIGKYVIPRGSSEVEIFDVDNQDSIEQFDKVGFSIKHQKAINHDDRLFWARFDFIDNPNNHHLLLGNWLRQIDEEIDLYWLIEESTGINDSEITDEKVGDVILASLLYFAAQNNKKVEMLDWLLGDEGIQYFENFDEYNLEAKKLLNAVKVIGSKLTKNSDKNLLINQLIETSLVQSIPLPKIF